MIKISVIIPTFNRTEFLREAIDSVLAQTLPASEILIIDDGSQQFYKDEVRAIAKLSSIITLYELPVNGGVSHARNFALEKVTGDYILFFDDDDLLPPNFFEFGTRELVKNSHLGGVIFSYQNLIAPDKKISFPISYFDYRNYEKLLEEDSFSVLLLCCPPIHSILLNKHSIGSVRFPEDLQAGEDWYFWLSLAAQGCRFKFYREVTVYYRRHANSFCVSEQVFFKKITNFFEKLQQSDMLRCRHDRFFVHFKLFLSQWKLGDMASLHHLLHSCCYPEFFVKYLGWYLFNYMNLMRSD